MTTALRTPLPRSPDSIDGGTYRSCLTPSLTRTVKAPLNLTFPPLIPSRSLVDMDALVGVVAGLATVAEDADIVEVDGQQESGRRGGRNNCPHHT